MARKMTPAEVKKAMWLNQPTQKVKCYGEIMHFKNRQAAMDFFWKELTVVTQTVRKVVDM